uniref:Helicase ATP-binding domain-containing protein n=1 Tax=Plectus sambesii TaxID=2011161 RepID=A0A914UJX5_9BILA
MAAQEPNQQTAEITASVKTEENEAEASTSSESNPASFAIDRSAIAQDRALLDEELALLGEHVAVYSQETLEHGFLSQVDQALEQQSHSQPQSQKASKFAQLVTAKTDDRVRFGELTPFELSAKQETSANDDDAGHHDDHQDEREPKPSSVPRAPKGDDDDEFEKAAASGSEYAPSGASSDSGLDEEADIDFNEEEELKPSSSKKQSIKSVKKRAQSSKSYQLKDDGDDKTFEKRMKALNDEALEKQIERDTYSTGHVDAHELSAGLRIPLSIWSRLYKYQKTGVRWLWELDQQSVGGVMGDEMGLGKTIQVISFLASLALSQLPVHGFSWKGLGPTLIICPATMMYQWVKECHQWFPKCRVAVFHQTGSFRGQKQRLISKMATARKDGSILITSYSTMTKERKLLLNHEWHYVILDEGHMIRNPNAQITMAVKEVRTPHRVIMSGSPLQNSLKELWSLIDFIYPGRLGSLQTFTEQFSIPITQGGYANATPVQVRTAYKCACVLR